MKESLDQQRARFAWEKVVTMRGQRDDYAKLAKGAPALIMASGLMPVLAFYSDKGKAHNKAHHEALRDHLCEWLQRRFGGRIADSQFATVMTALMGSANGDAAVHARFYQHATEETMAILRWIRQFAAAVSIGEKPGGPNA